ATCAPPHRLYATTAPNDGLMTRRPIIELDTAIAADHGAVRHAADRLVVRAAADRVAGAAPDRHVASRAADNRLAAVGRVDEDVGAAAAKDRLAGDAADRLVAAAPAGDRVGRRAPVVFLPPSAARTGL